MGITNKFKDLFLPEDEEYYDDYEENVEEEADELEHEPMAERSLFKKRNKHEVEEMADLSGLQFVLVKPVRFDDTPQIADYLIERKTVVLNLESANKDISRRIVDFLMGIAYALGGQTKKVALNTYIIIPSNAEISGELFDDMEGAGLSGLTF